LTQALSVQRSASWQFISECEHVPFRQPSTVHGSLSSQSAATPQANTTIVAAGPVAFRMSSVSVPGIGSSPQVKAVRRGIGPHGVKETVVTPPPVGGTALALNLMSVMCSPAAVAHALRAKTGGLLLHVIGWTD
jgi:hypothetical protein